MGSLNLWRKLRKSEHRRVQGLLSAYIDGEVSAGERALVEAHLKECLPCQRELASLRTTVDALRQMPSLILPRSFTLSEAPVRRRVSRAATSDMAWAYLRGATALAATLLALAFATELYQERLYPVPSPVTLLAPMAAKPAEPAAEIVATAPAEAGEALLEGTEAMPTKEIEKLVTIEVEKAVEREAVTEREVEEVAAGEAAVEQEAEEIAKPEVAEKAAEPEAEKEAPKEALAQEIPATPEPEIQPEVQAPTAATPLPKDEVLLASPPVEEKPHPVLTSPPAEKKEASPIALLEEATPHPVMVPIAMEEREGPSTLRWMEAGLLGTFVVLAAATFALARKRRSLHL